MRLVPLTQRKAKAYIAEHHRHLDPPVGDVIRVGLEADGVLVGVAMAGRPGARLSDDGLTLEVTRVATNGSPNACSMLYGAIRRAALALGWTKLVTFTLPEEGGASLRASGWRDAGPTRGGEWDRPSRRRKAAMRSDVKTRWVWP